MSAAWTDPHPADALLTQAADRFGTPAYVYFADAIAARLADLSAHLGRWFDLSYAMKCNPNPALLAWLAPRVPFLDVSSGGEFARARAAGWDAGRIGFTGPAKREAEIAAALSAGLGDLVIESLREARIADALARGMGRVQDVLIRLAPARVPKGFGDQMAGRPSPFGIDAEDAAQVVPQILALPGLRVTGLHIYSGTQCLRTQAIVENWRLFIDLFDRVAADHGLRPGRLVFGSGLGIPYHPGDVALDLAQVAAGIAPDLATLRRHPRLGQARLVLELGRHLVGQAGYFVTRVVSTKTSRGVRIALCDGGLNAHLAATGQFGMVLRRNYLMHRVGGGAGLERVDLTGPLCTSIDRLAGGVDLPPLAEGDLIAIHASGAYGYTASPRDFIGHPHPRELWVQDGRIADVTPPGA